MTNETTASQPTEFKGDTPALCRAIDALLTLDASGSLVPHGLGGHARTLLNAASLRLAASQPNSIGDDAQFMPFLDRLFDCSSAEEFNEVKGRFVTYIDNFRAPAAQASATIQAAPEGWTAILVNDGFGPLICALDRASRKGYLPDALTEEWEAFQFEDAPTAATIQEPVMVAEPVGDGLPPEVQKLFDQLRPEIDYWCTHRRESILAALDAIEFRFKVSQARTVRLESAAPMVADPAGVDDDEEDFYVHACEVMEQFQEKRAKRGVEIGTQGSLIDGIAWLYAHIDKLELAATVKAVPSEALDLMKEARELAPILRGMCEGGGADRGDDIYAADYQAPDGDVFVIRAAELLADFAAPLADKTGGRE